MDQFNTTDFESALDGFGFLSEDQKDQVRDLANGGSPIEATTFIRRKQPKIQQEFVIAFTENLRVLADLGLSSRQIKVMVYMLDAMEFGNLLMLNQKKMAEDLKIDSGNLSRDLKSLRSKSVLVEKNGHTYINSNLFAKGIKGGMDQEREKHLSDAKSDHNGQYAKAF